MTNMDFEYSYVYSDENLFKVARLHSFMAFAMYSLAVIVFIIFF